MVRQRSLRDGTVRQRSLQDGRAWRRSVRDRRVRRVRPRIVPRRSGGGGLLPGRRGEMPGVGRRMPPGLRGASGMTHLRRSLPYVRSSIRSRGRPSRWRGPRVCRRRGRRGRLTSRRRRLPCPTSSLRFRRRGTRSIPSASWRRRVLRCGRVRRRQYGRVPSPSCRPSRRPRRSRPSRRPMSSRRARPGGSGGSSRPSGAAGAIWTPSTRNGCSGPSRGRDGSWSWGARVAPGRR